jgi:hypothetical protein
LPFLFSDFIDFFFNVVFQKPYPQKITELSQVTEKNTPSELGVEISTFVPCERRWSWYRMTHCKVKDTGRGIV